MSPHRIIFLFSTMVIVAFALLVVTPALQPTPAHADPTPEYIVEAIEITGNKKTQTSLIKQLVLIREGDRLSVEDQLFETSQLRLLATGYFSDVQLSLKKGQQRGYVILRVNVVERWTILIPDLFFGTSEATTAWGGIGISERNLLGYGIGLEGSFVLGSIPRTKSDSGLQQGYWVRIIAPRITDYQLSVSASLLLIDAYDYFRNAGSAHSSSPSLFTALPYKRKGGTIGASINLGSLARLQLEYRIEHIHADVPIGAVQHVEATPAVQRPIDFSVKNGTSYLSNLVCSFEWDTRSDPVTPNRGAQLLLSGDLSSPFAGSSYSYFKFTAQYRHFFLLPWKKHVLSPQLFGGFLFGDAPFFEKFFIGDLNDLLPDRALGVNFSTLPSRSFLGTNITSQRYEQFAARLSFEYIIPWFRNWRWLYSGDFFINTGLIFLASPKTLSYREDTLGRSIPLDLTFDAGLRLDTPIGLFRFTVGNALGRIPY